MSTVTTPPSRHSRRDPQGDQTPDWLSLTARYVSELQYGQVILTIHQGNVIEVQKTERTRLNPGKGSSA